MPSCKSANVHVRASVPSSTHTHEHPCKYSCVHLRMPMYIMTCIRARCFLALARNRDANVATVNRLWSWFFGPFRKKQTVTESVGFRYDSLRRFLMIYVSFDDNKGDQKCLLLQHRARKSEQRKHAL